MDRAPCGFFSRSVAYDEPGLTSRPAQGGQARRHRFSVRAKCQLQSLTPGKTVRIAPTFSSPDLSSSHLPLAPPTLVAKTVPEEHQIQVCSVNSKIPLVLRTKSVLENPKVVVNSYSVLWSSPTPHSNGKGHDRETFSQ